MARRSDHKREELYEMAVSAAAQIAARDGFRAITARNVADAMGYSPGTIYNLFDNLDDLFLHVTGRTLDALFDELSGFSPNGDAEADLERLAGIYLSFISSNPDLWRMVFEFSLAKEQAPPEWFSLKIQRVMALLENCIAPLFPEDASNERRDCARVLWASLHGITTLAQVGKLSNITALDVPDMAEILIQNFLAGIAARRDGVA